MSGSTSITLLDVARKLRDLIQADADLAEWIESTFPGRTLCIFIGEHVQNPPGEDVAPYISIIPVRASVGEVEDVLVWSLELDLGLVEATQPADNPTLDEDDEPTGAYEMKGLGYIETMFYLVKAAIEAHQTNLNINISSFEPWSDAFPLHQASVSIECSHPALLGAEATL